MRRRSLLVAGTIAMLLTTLASAQMGGGSGRGMAGTGMMGHGAMGGSMLRHQYVMAKGIDPKYANARNPLVADNANLLAGKTLFEQYCATCHGKSGHGDGPAAAALKPAPADLSAAMRMPMSSDSYLDWTISEGGVPVQSAMPPFKASLSSDQIWKLVLYLRTL